MDAILEGNDVHRAPIKTYKLDIVQTNFGQFIVDQESKQKTNIEEATQTANKELEDEDEII